MNKEYRQYLLSPEWKKLRNKLISERGKSCQWCGRSCRSVHVHHLTYDRIFNEHPDDLVLVCKECHRRYHKKPRLSKKERKKLRRERRGFKKVLTQQEKIEKKQRRLKRLEARNKRMIERMNTLKLAESKARIGSARYLKDNRRSARLIQTKEAIARCVRNGRPIPEGLKEDYNKYRQKESPLSRAVVGCSGILGG